MTHWNDNVIPYEYFGGEYMEPLDEAKEIMQAAGCSKAFPIYDLELSGIAEVKGCH